MTLRLFNTLTKTKTDFAPIDAKNVRMYVCGPTVYDFAHIGNARPAIVFDVLYRLLKHLAGLGEWDGGKGETQVTYVRNITDVDDKINERALRDFPGLPLNEAIRNVTEKTEKQYHDDVDALGCLRPDFEPRATDFVLPRPDGKADMSTLIAQLIARGHAYEAGGEVLFDVQSMPDYGLLSGRRLDEQKAGARVAVDAHKKHPHDFVLWKLSADNEPGWESRWGRGRPGWHIECSAMSAAYLGTMFDIHGGGLDLIFPHHENEIAQSRCAHGTPLMANVWMHNGFLQVEGEKMSKSAGNFFTIHELLDKWPGDALRLNMLRTNYDQPIDWQLSGLVNAMNDLRAWTEVVAMEFGWDADLQKIDGEIDPQVLAALSDNLNTHLALSRLDQLSGEVRSGKARVETFIKSGQFLGFKHLNKPGYFDLGFAANIVESGPKPTPSDQIEIVSYRAAMANTSPTSVTVTSKLAQLNKKGFVVAINQAGVLSVSNTTSADFEGMIEGRIAERTAAKKARDFKKADSIRKELLELNDVELEDKPDGSTTWRVRR